MSLLVAIIMLVAVLSGLGLFFYTMRYAPYVRTSREVLRDLLELAAIKPGEHVIDLGSGDGRLLVAAAERGATVEGYELNPLLVAWSRRRLKGKGTVHLANFFSADVSGADVVFIYGLPNTMARLESQLRQQLKPGARVVSNAFHFVDWPVAATQGKATLYRA